MEKPTNFIEALNYRRSVRVYDASKQIDTAIVKKCLQQATLAPNSSNMQLWEFHHVTSSNILEKLTEACLDQSAAKTAKEMVVIVVRKDLKIVFISATLNVDEFKKYYKDYKQWI